MRRRVSSCETATGAGIANYRALAYKSESARKILGNVFTYITLE